MDDYKIKPLSIILQKTSVYKESFDSEIKWLYFFD